MSNPALEVGSLVRATLVSKAVVEGAVFSFDEDTGMLILMEVHRNPNAANQSFKDPNVHVLNVQFISNIEFISETDSGATATAAGGSSSSSANATAGKHLMPLPRSVLGDTLPAAENRDYTKLMNKLKAEQKKRTGLYHDLASIDACDTFEYFLKLNPDLKWSTEQHHLDKATRVLNGNNDSAAPVADDANSIKLVLVVSGGNILLSGNNELGGYSWKLPKVIPANDNVSPDLVARMTKQAEACATKTA